MFYTLSIVCSVAPLSSYPGKKESTHTEFSSHCSNSLVQSNWDLPFSTVENRPDKRGRTAAAACTKQSSILCCSPRLWAVVDLLGIELSFCAQPSEIYKYIEGGRGREKKKKKKKKQLETYRSTNGRRRRWERSPPYSALSAADQGGNRSAGCTCRLSDWDSVEFEKCYIYVCACFRSDAFRYSITLSSGRSSAESQGWGWEHLWAYF